MSRRGPGKGRLETPLARQGMFAILCILSDHTREGEKIVRTDEGLIEAVET